MLDVLDKLPKRLWVIARRDPRQAGTAPARAEYRKALEAIVAWLRRAGQGQRPRPEGTRLRDLDDFLTFYDFPQGHWTHLRTTNPIESIFAGGRLRMEVTKRLPNRENALYLLFKVIGWLGQHWRHITGSNLCRLALDGRPFVDGHLVEAAVA